MQGFECFASTGDHGKSRRSPNNYQPDIHATDSRFIIDESRGGQCRAGRSRPDLGGAAL